MGFKEDAGFEETQVEQKEGVESETTDDESRKTEEGETATEETQEESKEEAKSDAVPASFQKRIDELTWKYKSERESRVKLEEELRSKRANPSEPTTEEAKKEQAARDYLTKLVDERLGSIKSEQEKADKELQNECDHVSTLYPDFNKTKVLEVMEKYSISDVEKGYNAWKEMSRVVEQTKEQTKKEIISKPKSPSSVKTVDGYNNKVGEKTLKDKSIYELVEDAKQEAGL